MNQILESILNKGKILTLTGLMFLTPLALNAQSLQPYAEAKVGTIIPVAEKQQEYKPSLLIGGACGINVGKLGLEIGLDYFHSSKEYIETNSFLRKFNVIFSPFEQKAKVKPYLIAGANFLSEFSSINIPQINVHDRVINTTPGIEFGIGATIFDKIDGRLSYMAMPSSENVKGMVSLMGGYRFLLGGKK